MRVVVVGAGIVGMSTTLALRRAGADVVCLESTGVVMGERSAGSSRIFRLAHAAPALVEYRLLDSADGLGLPARAPSAPALVDLSGGVVDVDAARRFLGAEAVDLPRALEHHVRFTFAMDEAMSPPAWIDHPARGVSTYQHRTGPGRWSVGAMLPAGLVAWENGRDAATTASRDAVVEYARERLTVDPAVVDELFCTHAPDTGDGILFRRSGPVLAMYGENLMKFVPVLGETLAAAALDGSTPADRG